VVAKGPVPMITAFWLQIELIAVIPKRGVERYSAGKRYAR